MQNALSCQNVDVRFDAVHALKDVSLSFEAGKIHALLGQNGAGKSTIAKVLSGVLTPENGTLEILGRSVKPGNATATQAAGLDIVHQRFALPPTFTVAEALEFASARKMGGPLFSRRKVEKAWAARLEAANIAVHPRAKLSSLPVETAQSLEILRALANDAQVLILDEPTALLSPSAIEDLFGKLRELKDQGVTLIVVLHKLKEVMEIADTVTILREGAKILGPDAKDALSQAQISEAMIGDVSQTAENIVRADVNSPTHSLFKFDRVSSTTKGGEVGLNNASFTLNMGEIIGVAGIEGNGQRALAEVFAGIATPSAGTLNLDGTEITSLSVAQRRDRGIRSVPFDRMTEGASLSLTLWENTKSWMAGAFRSGPWPNINLRRLKAETREDLDHFGVVYHSLNQVGGTLSGGNLQRVILARELSGNVSALLAAQPTRGLDFGATAFVWQELDRARAAGAGIILISSDLDELFGICDRILVMRGGEVAGTFTPSFSAREIGAAMVGADL